MRCACAEAENGATTMSKATWLQLPLWFESLESDATGEEQAWVPELKAMYFNAWSDAGERVDFAALCSQWSVDGGLGILHEGRSSLQRTRLISDARGLHRALHVADVVARGGSLPSTDDGICSVARPTLVRVLDDVGEDCAVEKTVEAVFADVAGEVTYADLRRHPRAAAWFSSQPIMSLKNVFSVL